MKKDQYFNLEVNFLSDDNVVRMTIALDPAQATGIYLTLLLHLRKKDDYEASCDSDGLQVIAHQYGFDQALVDRVIREFGLFTVDEERQTFRSAYMDRVMKQLEERRRKESERGQKGGRPKTCREKAETPSTKGKEPDEKQKSKVEVSRGEVSIAYVDNNSSNREESVTPVSTAAVAEVGVVIRSEDEKGQRPLQAVLPCDKLVDQLPTCQGFMEMAGMHSGLGRLFINHQKRILELFKTHIRLYGKEDQLLFLDDVKHYFANYVAAGSLTCRSLRATLLEDSRYAGGKNPNRFETIVGGKRTYMGHSIPFYAPPRPDSSAVWDEAHRKWSH